MLRILTAMILITLAGLSNADVSPIKTDDNKLSFIGYAYDLETEKLLYTEHHQYLDAVTHEVTYAEPSGEIFAKKSVDYQHSYYSPNILQTNNRNGELIDITRNSKADKKVAIRYQENSTANIQKGDVNFSPNLIIDAGFDQFITRNWDTLVNSNNGVGKEKTIDYLIPSALDHYKLSIKKESCENYDNYCFSISASSFFISLFSSDLELTYSKKENESPRLLSFQGRSNICDSEGNYQDVTIMYKYDNL